MSNVPTATHRVKVVAIYGNPENPKHREETLIDEPLTLATLALLEPLSPLSSMLLDGAGMKYRPRGIAVFVDGKRVWSKECPHHGATDAYATHEGGRHIDTIPFTDAFGDDYDDERLAANRAAWEHLRNDHDSADAADDWAADVIEAAGSLRPILRPSPAEPESTGPHAPCPCERYGDRTTPLGLPYKPVRQVRKTENGVEMLVGHEFATL